MNATVSKTATPAAAPPAGAPGGHGPGETSDSPQRPAQCLTGSVLSFDLVDELARLHREPAWQRGERNAITLVKTPDCRVVLTVLQPGARVQEHQVSAPFTLHVIEGALRLHLPDHAVEVAAGQLLAFERGMAHDVEALEESAFLLTIARPEDGRVEA